MSNILGSVLSNCQSTDATLRSILRQRKKESLLTDIDEHLLHKLHAVFLTGVKVFDTLQNVVPAFYLLRNVWDDKNSTDERKVKLLKKELVAQIDDKVWSAITAVHLTATYLDPALREFVFVPSARDRVLFITQAKDCFMAYVFDGYEKRPERYTGQSNDISSLSCNSTLRVCRSTSETTKSATRCRS